LALHEIELRNQITKGFAQALRNEWHRLQIEGASIKEYKTLDSCKYGSEATLFDVLYSWSLPANVNPLQSLLITFSSKFRKKISASSGLDASIAVLAKLRRGILSIQT
jgi:hypothetical protein